MNLLYINYGSQSGVVDSVAAKLRSRGVHVEVYNPVDAFFFQRRIGAIRIPRLRFSVIASLANGIRAHRKAWKTYFFFTSRMFDLLTSVADEACLKLQPDVVLQAGALFAPTRSCKCRYFLYVDNTAAIAERHVPMLGLPPPLGCETSWKSRERSVYEHAEGIFTMSEFVKRSLVEDYGIDSARVHVVGAGAIVMPSAAAAFALPRQPAFLFVGVDFVRKGGPQLLAAFDEVRRVFPTVELWLVGGYGLPSPKPGIRCFGRLGRTELAELYSRACCFVLPTLREPFGLVFLEAMAFGLPCIGTNVQAVPEIIVDGVTGFLVPPGDAKALARSMLMILREPEQASAMGKAGHARLSVHFGWDRVAEAMSDVLRPD